LTEDTDSAVGVIRDRAPGFTADVAIILGSGLGDFASVAEDAIAIPYDELPRFPEPGVAGHAGTLVLGYIGGTSVAILQGRSHYYESGRADGMKGAVHTLAALGARCLVVTNAAGCLHPDKGPGSIMLLTDHINFAGVSPLFGARGDDRFVDLVNAYDPDLRRRLHEAAKADGIALHEGVYMWFCGPHFETPAEIRAARILGADAVGMSTVPEVILARHAGMKVAALSIITNLAAGIGETALSHAQTMAASAAAADTMAALLRRFLADYGNGAR
jgi:purine nucleotide phosphorylase